MMLSLPLRAPLCAAPGVRRSHGAPTRLAPVTRSLHGSQDAPHYANNPTLYTGTDADGTLSPESQSTMIALLEKGLPFQRVQVDMATKPEAFRELYHALIPLADVKERVPLLLDGHTHLADASIINEYLEQKYKNQGARLMPDDPGAAARVRLFISFFRDTVLPRYQRIVHVDNPSLVEECHRQLLAALEGVDQFLKLHGGSATGAVGPHGGWQMRDEDETGPAGPYFLGRMYTMAEVACTPWIARLALVLPEWRGFDVVEECNRAGYTRVASWMRACLERPSALRTDPSQAEMIHGLVQKETARTT